MEGTDEGESCETDKRKKEKKTDLILEGEGKIGVENGEVTAARERAEGSHKLHL